VSAVAIGIRGALPGFEEMVSMRMSAKAGVLIVLLACHGLSQAYSEAARAIALPKDGQPSSHYWKSEPVEGTAQLLTLFCRSCGFFHDDGRDVPLVTVLRDTLGDKDTENDRVTFIWLFTDAHPRLVQRILSAIPFFYWEVGGGARSDKAPDRAPMVDLSAPQHPMMAQVARDMVQWTVCMGRQGAGRYRSE
jgi:hypothetical protein